MSGPDLILLHPPSIFGFREKAVFYGPVSDVVPSSSLFEIYPIGFLTISKYLHSRGLSVRIINLAMKMMRDSSFDPDAFIAKLDTDAFGIDLHWLTHADGSLSLAEMIKKHHFDKPVIFGGLSATYYYQEIMRDYPCVDFIIRGDSAEEPLRLLLESIKAGGGYEAIPNLVWRNDNGDVIVNDDYYQPENMDYIDYDYSHLLTMAIKYRDPFGYMPFKGWLSTGSWCLSRAPPRRSGWRPPFPAWRRPSRSRWMASLISPIARGTRWASRPRCIATPIYSPLAPTAGRGCRSRSGAENRCP